MSIRSSQLKNKPNIDFIQRITLSPFEKYVRFNFFPWKFVLHVMLVALTTYQALKIVSIQDKYTRIQEEVFSTLYLQSDDGQSTFPYYSLTDFTDAFFGVVQQTQNLNETLLQYSSVKDVVYRLKLYYSQITESVEDKMIIEGDREAYLSGLASVPLEKGRYDQMKEFLQKIQRMTLEINNVITYISMSNQTLGSCLNWTISISYSFASFANIEASLETSSAECLSVSDTAANPESILAVHLAVLVIASVSLVLQWKQIYQVSKSYMGYKNQRLQGHSEQMQKDWEQLGFFQKIKFFDFWFGVIVAANFFQLFGALVAILDILVTEDLSIFSHKEVLIGFGVMLAWVSVLKYLEYNPNLNLMTATLSKSWGNLSMFLLGVMPFFLGFVFLGQTIFWKYSKFEDTSSTVITLFSLLNGDIVNDTFLQTWAEGLMGQIYLIVFMVLFYTAVQNVFVTIIMEGYQESIKEQEYKKMLEEKDSLEKKEFEKHLEQIQDQEEGSFAEMPMTPEQYAGLSKVKKDGKKIDKLLEEMEKVVLQVNASELPHNQKTYLNKMVKDSLEFINRSVKTQLKEFQTN